jgi:hypothetical protein
VFDQAPVVRAWLLEHLVKDSRADLERGTRVLVFGSSHKGVLARLLALFLLFGVAAGAALVDVLLPLLLTLGVMEDCPNRLLTGGKVGGSV